MHDAAVVLLDHVRPRGAGGVERAADVHGEVLREIVGVDVGHARPADDAGVVDQDVDAPELLDRARRRAPARRRRSATSLVSAIATPPAATISAATVDAGPASAPTPCIEPPRSLTTTRAPRVGEQAGVGAADPAARAGDDRDAPVEAVLAHASPLS